MPEPDVLALSPIRTYWEKITLIHVECYRKRLSTNANRLSRHWYELSYTPIHEDALKRIDILIDVLKFKTAFFNASYCNYSKCLEGKISLIPEGNELNSLEKDYLSMIKSNMFPEAPPQFVIIKNRLSEILNEINSTIYKFKNN